MLRRSALAAGALLGLFHVWLLGNQLWTGQLAQFDVVLRWLVAAALIAGLVVLRRRGVPMVFGRQAVAVWLLAALLHGPALANDLDGFATPALPEAVATIGQSLITSAIGLALLALAAFAGARDARRMSTRFTGRTHAVRSVASAHAVRFLPRPPPLR
ncbi:MAG: hypothetical protein AB7H93_07690 [Vicinamibacterales bacterium]